MKCFKNSICTEDYLIDYDRKTPYTFETIEIKDGVKSGAFSLRGAVEILEHQTGRKLSAMGLKKIIDREPEQEPNGLLSRDDKAV